MKNLKVGQKLKSTCDDRDTCKPAGWEKDQAHPDGVPKKNRGERHGIITVCIYSQWRAENNVTPERNEERELADRIHLLRLQWMTNQEFANEKTEKWLAQVKEQQGTDVIAS